MTLMGGLEYLARSLAVLHEHDPQHTFQLAATDALASFPPGSILQIAVADSGGRIVYSSLSPDSATLGIDPETVPASRPTPWGGKAPLH